MFLFVFEINPDGLAHLTYFGLLIPVMVMRGRQKIRNTEGPLPNRLRHFQVTSFSLVGSLYVAMAVHIAYDITAGLSYGRLGKELGYSPEISESPATS